MRRILILPLLIGLGCVACGTEPSSDPVNATSTTSMIEDGPMRFDPLIHKSPGEHEIEIVVDGEPRSYKLVVPDSFDPDEPTAMVLAFHGWTMSPDQMVKGAWNLLSQESGFLLVAPAGLDSEWAVAHDEAEALSALPDSTATLTDFPAGDRDVLFASLVLSELNEYFLIDQSRVYVTGESLGGWMASRVACDLGGQIAALGATYNSVLYSESCPSSAPLGVVSVGHRRDTTHAISDALSSIEAWAEHNGCAPIPTDSQAADRVTLTAFEGCGENAEVRMYVHDIGWRGDADERQIWEFFTSSS